MLEGEGIESHDSDLVLHKFGVEKDNQESAAKASSGNLFDARNDVKVIKTKTSRRLPANSLRVLTGEGELHDKKIHPGFPSFAHHQSHYHRRIPENYQREKDPEDGELLGLK